MVLAAGYGQRLRPLSLVRPKALCPVAGVPLVDLALDRLGAVDAAVNVHHHRPAMEAHLGGRAHLSIEADEPLGTAGALGHLREWIAGRATLVVNADAWCPVPATVLLDGWDGERIRVLVAGDRLEATTLVAGALMPWADVDVLGPTPSGLWESSWRTALDAGRVEAVPLDGPVVDCGTPARYLAANLAATGGASAIEPGAQVGGRVDRCVVWSDGVVHPSESLADAIRYGGERTVLVRGR